METNERLAEMATHAAHLSAWAADRSGSGLASESDEVVLATLQQVEYIARLLGAVQAHTAAIVEERSDYGGVQDGLAFKYGFSRAAPLVEYVTLIGQSEARRRIRLGKNIRERMSMTGEPMAPLFPRVANAITTGEISTEAGERIIQGLEQARTHHLLGEEEMLGEFEENVAAAEKALVDEARREPLDLVSIQVNVWKNALDPDGAPMRDEDIRARRGLRRSKERNGVVTWMWKTTGETTALVDEILAVARAATKPRFVPTDTYNPDNPDGCVLATPEETAALLADNTLDGTGDDPHNPHSTTGGVDPTKTAVVTSLKDTRSHEQRDSDVLDGYLRAGVRASENEMGSTRSAIEVIAVATIADLEAGRGVGWIDGLEEPVSIEYIKEMACGTGYRLVVQGEDGEVLWLGPKPRLFTDAQKRAAIVRDGPVCVAPGCTKPARQTEVHHVEFHSRGGPTDIDNAVCLCVEHHHMIHKSPFTIEMHNGKPFMLAPRWLDPSQTWKPLGHPKYRNRPRVHERFDWETQLQD
jgi:hypothetical protein